jgi:hypothetical protein
MSISLSSYVTLMIPSLHFFIYFYYISIKTFIAIYIWNTHGDMLLFYSHLLSFLKKLLCFLVALFFFFLFVCFWIGVCVCMWILKDKLEGKNCLFSSCFCYVSIKNWKCFNYISVFEEVRLELWFQCIMHRTRRLYIHLYCHSNCKQCLCWAHKSTSIWTILFDLLLIFLINYSPFSY